MIKLAYAATCALLVMLANSAAASEIACPVQLTAPKVSFAGLAPGWIPSATSVLYLTAAGASSGPPELGATLRGEDEFDKRRSEWRTTFDFGTAGNHHGKWIDCIYGEAGDFTLSKRLPDSIARCTVRRKNDVKARPRYVRIDCE